MPARRSVGPTSQAGRAPGGRGRARMDPLARPSASTTQASSSRYTGSTRDVPTDIIQPTPEYLGPSSTDTSSAVHGRADGASRSDLLCDILSTFDCNILPGEFRAQIANRVAPPLRLEDCLQPDSLSNTLYQMAMVEPTICDALRLTVPETHCADDYLNKQRMRIFERLNQMDNAVEQARMPSHVLRPNVIPECGNDLRRIVENLYQYRMQREALPLQQCRELTTLLVEVVERVCERNYDHRSSNKTRAVSNKFNLFEYLIRSPDKNGSQYESFVVDKLGSLQVDEWGHLGEALASIREGLLQLPHREQSPLSVYVRVLSDMVKQANEPE